MNPEELEELVLNVEAHCTSIETDMAAYMEANPKTNDRWLEARLRALEDKVQTLMVILVDALTGKKLSERDATLLAKSLIDQREPNEKLKELIQ